MKILEKYLLKEFLHNWYGVTSILMLILVSKNLISALNKAIKGTIDSSVILPLVVTNIFQFSLILIPLGLFLGIMLGMGRLYQDSEMSAAYACGLSPARILKPVLVTGLMGFIIVFILAFWVAPWAADIEQRIMVKEKSKQEIDKVEAGRFNVSQDHNTVIFARNKDKDKDKDTGLQSVFVQSTKQQEGVVAEVAQSAKVELRYEDELPFFVLKNGSTYSHGNIQNKNKEEGDISITQYEEHGVLLGSKVQKKESQRLKATPTKTLLASSDIMHKAELQWRISLCASTIIMALLALPLSHSAPRKSRNAKIIVAVIIYIFYANLLIYAVKSMRSGAIPEQYGMWWVYVVCLFIISIMFIKRQVKG